MNRAMHLWLQLCSVIFQAVCCELRRVILQAEQLVAKNFVTKLSVEVSAALISYRRERSGLNVNFCKLLNSSFHGADEGSMQAV